MLVEGACCLSGAHNERSTSVMKARMELMGFVMRKTYDEGRGGACDEDGSSGGVHCVFPVCCQVL